MNVPEAMKVLKPLLPQRTGSNCSTWPDLCAIAAHIESLKAEVLELWRNQP